MKYHFSILSQLCLSALLVAVSVAQNQATSPAQVPQLVKFSGTVKDDAGKPISGVLGITFALYKDQEGGAPLWLETKNVQPDASGHYTVMLGSTKAEGLPEGPFSSNEARWVGVQPQGQAEQPRVMLLSVPYALKASDAETLGGKPASAFVPASSSNSAPAPRATKSALPGPQISGSMGTTNPTETLIQARKFGSAPINKRRTRQC
jgi:hypothetical protein